MNPAAALTLTDFLLARITEDEEVARAATPGPWKVNSTEYPEYITGPDGYYVVSGGRWGGEASIFESPDEAFHIARWDPARVLAECEAKRRMMGRALDLIASFGDWDAPEAVAAGGSPLMWENVNRRERSQAHDTLALLALPYAGHPDFREEWRA